MLPSSALAAVHRMTKTSWSVQGATLTLKYGFKNQLRNDRDPVLYRKPSLEARVEDKAPLTSVECKLAVVLQNIGDVGAEHLPG